MDDLTVFSVEAELIRSSHAEVLSQPPHPMGACAFLDESGGCRIYPCRPYVCRTQGLPLRYLEEDEEHGLVEYRDICELNDTALSLTELEPSDCWTIGPVEARLRLLQQSLCDCTAAAVGSSSRCGASARIALRRLFR